MKYLHFILWSDTADIYAWRPDAGCIERYPNNFLDKYLNKVCEALGATRQVSTVAQVCIMAAPGHHVTAGTMCWDERGSSRHCPWGQCSADPAQTAYQ